MRYALSIATLAVILGVFCLTTLEGAFNGITPLVILAIAFAGLLVARRVVATRSAR
jgi:hypothetical protein